MQPGLRDLRADIGAKPAVHGGPDLVVARPGEADAVDRGDRNEGREDQPRQGEEFDRARAQLTEHVGVRAKLIVGENLDLDAPVGLRLDAVHRLFGAHVKWVRHRNVVGIFEGELRGSAGDPWHCDGCAGGGARQKRGAPVD